MKSSNRTNRNRAVSALIVATFCATTIGSAMAQDGAERMQEFHQAAIEQRSNADQNVDQIPSSSVQIKQSEDRPDSFKRFQKRHRYGFLKPNGR